MTSVLDTSVRAAAVDDGTSTINPGAPRSRSWRPPGRDRLAYAGLLVATALLYLVGLSKSGWANQFYAGAADAGSRSWKAMLFGSLDSANFITVDKPPAALWVMDLSVRIFGLSSWSILVPQALEGVAAVALVYAAVRRVSTPTAGLLAGAVLATTPVAALMFRYDNPDALLILLMSAAAYATVRALEHARGRWLVLAGVLLGFAFLTKMLQGFLVVPGFALAYLLVAPTRLRTRICHLLAAGAAMLVAAGWWVALVELWPAGSRPYIGGSTNNSILELVFGYNGIGRLTGSSNNGNTSGGTGGFSSGEAGLTRMFASDTGTQISWLLPAALVAVAALAWVTRRRPRTDVLRGSLIVWGGWLLVTGLVLSFATGIIHPYYSVALAPAIASLVGIGVVTLWQERRFVVPRALLTLLIFAGATWTFELLGRADWNSWLRWFVLAAGAAAIAVTMIPAGRIPRAGLLVSAFIAVSLLAGPTAYSLQTASTAHTGAIPSAGPSSAGFGAGGRAGGGPGGGGAASFAGANAGGARPGGTAATNPGTATRTGAGGTTGTAAGGRAGGGVGGLGNGGPGNGGLGNGGLGGATTVSAALTAALQADSSKYAWSAATTSDNEAASLELSTGTAVMSLGGYNGTDAAISLTSFEKLAAAGKVHYYVLDSSGFIGSSTASTSTAYAIQQWVEKNYSATTVGGTTVYNLAAG